MGCVASKLEEEEEVVSICRERKNQLKLAVERRYALAEAHCRYHQSLFAVSAAIKVFVARHSSPSSPFLITFPPSSSSATTTTENPSDEAQAQKLITNPVFLQQIAPSEATIECAGFCDSSRTFSSSSSSSSEEEEEEEEEHKEGERREEQAHHQPSGYYYMQMPSSMASPQRDFGWDFFNPFDGVHRAEIISGGGYRRNSDEDELKVVREEEGIPELEEEEEEEEDERRNNNAVGVEERRGESEDVMINNSNNVVCSNAEGGGEGEEGDRKGLQVIDTPSQGRELLEALKDVEDYFIKAHDSGLHVSRMLEANTLRMQSGLDHIKENSTKLNQSIAWHRSISARPSTCKSLVASSSKSSSSTWTEFNNDLFDDYGGMTSGSHSLTLGRIYAWEKKLYEEVKAGDTTRKLYEKKCSRLRNQDVKGDDELSVDKTRAAVKDLYARILVAIRSAESISMRIEKLRDEELQPQILELLKGLLRTWKTMLEAHETQNKIMFEVKTFATHELGKFCTNSHRLATIQIVAELHNWRARLVDYVAAQRSYVAALHAWLAKFVVPEVELFSRSKGSPLSFTSRGPPLLAVCRDWLVSTEKLPEKPAAAAMKGFAREVAALWDHQGEERRQMRKVNAMAKELERRAAGVGESDGSDEPKRREQLDSLRARLEAEKERHRGHVRETHRLTLTGFRTGFCNVFESLIDFSKASQNMYNDLVERAGNDGDGVAFIEDASKVEEANGSSR